MARRPEVALAFTSPRNHGLKVFIRLEEPYPATNAEHRAIWMALYHNFGRLLPAENQSGEAVVNDVKVRDIARLCYLTNDPHTYFNPNAKPLAWRTGIERDVRNTYPPSYNQKPGDKKIWWEAAQYVQVSDYNLWFGVLCNLKSLGFTAEEVEEWSALNKDKYVEGEVIGKWKDIKDSDPYPALLRSLAEAVGWKLPSGGGRKKETYEEYELPDHLDFRLVREGVPTFDLLNLIRYAPTEFLLVNDTLWVFGINGFWEVSQS